MKIFGSKSVDAKDVLAVQTREALPYGIIPISSERALYKSLREAVPIIDASIVKIRRLIGSFQVTCADKEVEKNLKRFLKTVRVGAVGAGIDEFIGTYFEELLTYGNAVGEMVMSAGRIAALYNADLNNISIEEVSPLNIVVSSIKNGALTPCPYQELILCSALNSEAGCVRGVSLLRGLPFVSDILLRIYRTIGVNWERIGNVRFAVSCKQDNNSYAPERAKNVAGEWQKAMRSSTVSDFISVGDVSIKAIGADIQILDSEIPVRQMLEQIVAKMGIPPFLLGLSWSSTERMSSQQADILTSELEAYRRLLEPVIVRIIDMWMSIEGKSSGYEIIWNEITMQDEVDHANALYLAARAKKTEAETEKMGVI